MRRKSVPAVIEIRIEECPYGCPNGSCVNDLAALG
jgi:hypothetical protein